MEALFFRFLARELATILVGARLEKIFLPSPNSLCLGLFFPAPQPVAGQLSRHGYLHVRSGSGRFFCFCSLLKTGQPLRAPAEAMRLRKHLRGRRLERVVADWPARCLVLVPSGPGPALRLDPRARPELVADPPRSDPPDPVWPPLDAVLTDPDIWRAHPQLSPELRRRLAALPREAAGRLYARLVAGEHDGFFVEFREDMPAGVWPVSWPDGLARRGRTERFATALEAAAAFGQPLAFAEVSGREAAPARAAATAAHRRLTRALARLDADEARMHRFLARRREADALAAGLYALDPRAKLPRLTLPSPEGPPLTVELDPALTVVQNMQKLYHLVAKGQRGLLAIAARRRDLQDGKKTLKGRECASGPRQKTAAPTGGVKGVAAHVYRTSDGFVAWRGRNAKANEQLLRQANPFDLWLHVADGPGAHVILRRDHPGREVPRRSLLEAAGLAALASYAGRAGAAEVLVALVGDVRRFKGAAVGRVSVGAVLETVRVSFTPDLENLRETS